MTHELLDLDATAQAELVRSGEVRPRELVEAAITRIEEVDPRLNAVIHRQFDRALADADRPASGPFGGVPFLLKDFGGWEAGEPYCAGTAGLRDAGFRARTDSSLATAFRRAGLIPLGRTNTPELAMMGTTEPVAFGPTHNPWAPGRSPGGSSGGSAAAVATRCVAAAHANDIAGSIRIPSAHCGVVGLKPTRNRTLPSGPVSPPVGMNTEGVVTRTVRDTAGLVDAIGVEPGPSWWLPPALAGPLTAEVGAEPGRLRIGLCIEAFNGSDVDKGCAAAATDAASLLADLGHSVEEDHPAALRSDGLQDAMRTALAATADADLRHLSSELGRELGEVDVEANTWRAISGARSRTGADLVAALAMIETVARRSMGWWADDGFDLLVTPTTAEAPTKHGEYVSGYQPGRASAFTRVFNATGQPALSLPLGWPDDGLPRGVQLVAAHGREDLLIRVGSALEEAAPWRNRRPSL